MWGAYIESWVILSHYSWTIMLHCLKFIKSWVFNFLISLKKNLSNKVSLKHSVVMGTLFVLLFSFHWVCKIWATSWSCYDVIATWSFPYTWSTWNIFLTSSLKGYGSSAITDPKNSSGFILIKFGTLITAYPTLAFSWTRTYWLIWLVTLWA